VDRICAGGAEVCVEDRAELAAEFDTDGIQQTVYFAEKVMAGGHKWV